jgi:hypothetical protein
MIPFPPRPTPPPAPVPPAGHPEVLNLQKKIGCSLAAAHAAWAYAQHLRRAGVVASAPKPRRYSLMSNAQLESILQERDADPDWIKYYSDYPRFNPQGRRI